MSLESIPSAEVEQQNANNIHTNTPALQAKLARITAAALLVAGGTLGVYSVESTASAPVAHADAIDDALASYPDIGDACQPVDVVNPPQRPTPASPYVSCNYYDWGVPKSGGGFSLYSSRGYGYRNCTDWAAFRVNQASNGTVSVSNNLKDAKNWYDNSPATEQSRTPKAGEVAVSTSGSYGHVAFVEAVSPDGSSMTISEYNYDMDGHGDQRTIATSNSEFTEYIDYGINMGANSTTPSGPNFMPAVVQRTSGETDVAVVGPANSLDFYYNPAGSSSWGKTSVPNAAYSTPAVIQRPSGETDIAVQGPGNSMDFYYNMPGSPNWGVSHVAAPGWALSAPAVVQRSSGETDIAVEGPNNELDFYFNTPGSPYWGEMPIAGGGTAYSAPAMIQRPSRETDIAVQGPNNTMDFYYNMAGSSSWGVSHVASPNEAYSAPAVVQRSSGETDIAVQGPNNELDLYINTQGSGGWGRIPAAGPGSTYGAPNPPVMVQRPTGETDIAVQGAGNQANLYYNAQGSPDWGESVAAVSGYALHQPAMVLRANNGETDFAVIGTNNRLDFYFNAQGAPYWANMPIAGNNSAS